MERKTTFLEDERSEYEPMGSPDERICVLRVCVCVAITKRFDFPVSLFCNQRCSKPWMAMVHVPTVSPLLYVRFPPPRWKLKNEYKLTTRRYNQSRIAKNDYFRARRSQNWKNIILKPGKYLLNSRDNGFDRHIGK